jgi:uncharacterized membrane protein (DUF373 family)
LHERHRHVRSDQERAAAAGAALYYGGSMKQILGPIGHRFEAIIVVVLQLALMLMVGWAVLELLWLLGLKLVERTSMVNSLADVQEHIERGFAGVLLVLIGLELLESVRVYFKEHRVRLEVILTVSTIAVVRHVILLDLEHASPLVLVGTAALVLALAISLFVVSRSKGSESAQIDPASTM